jgi:hypothetical protein
LGTSLAGRLARIGTQQRSDFTKVHEERDKSLFIFHWFFVFRYRLLIFFVFARFEGRPEGGGSTSRGLAANGEWAEGNEFFKGSVDTVALDVAMKEAPDLILRQSVP